MKESGISVSLTNRARGLREKPSTFKAILVAVFGWLYLVFETSGMVLALTDAFHIELQKATIWLFVILASLAVTLLLGSRKWYGTGLIVLLAFLAGYGILFHTQLKTGFLYIWNCIGVGVDKYFFALPEEISAEAVNGQAIQLAVLMIVLGLVALLGISILVLRKISMPLLLAVLMDLLILLIGLMPSTESVLLQLFGLIGAGVMGSCSDRQPVFTVATRVESAKGLQQKMQLQSSVVILLAAGVILAVSLLLLNPVYAKIEEYRDVTDQWKQNIRDFTINDWERFEFSLTDKGSMGINGGTLGDYQSISSKQQVDLSITADVDYSGTVLIKGFAAGLYGGDHWEQIALQDWAQVRLGEGTWTVKEDTYIAPEYAILSHMDSARDSGRVVLSAEMQVRLLHARSEYSYLPGFAQASRFGTSVPVYGWAEGLGSNASYVTALADPSWLLDQFGLVGENVTGQYDTITFSNGSEEATVEYEQFVDDHYLQVPGQALADVQANWNRYLQGHMNGPNTYKEIAYQVVSYLNERAEYSLLPGKTPKGTDFITYFLFSQQKGYCVHFATTATLLFRMAGVPARYVEGYSMDGLQAGVTTLIEDDKAHAWCEIYVTGFGWVPVDVTPGSQGSEELISGTLEEPEGREETVPAEPSAEEDGTQEGQTEMTTVVPDGEQETIAGTEFQTLEGDRELETDENGDILYDDDGKPMVGTSGHIGITLLRIVGSIVGLVLLCVLIRMAVQKRSAYLLGSRLTRMRQKNVRLAILAAYQYATGMTKEAGRSVTVDTTEETFQKEYSGLDGADLRQFQSLVKEAYFSRHEMSEDQRADVLAFYQSLYQDTLYQDTDDMKKARTDGGGLRWRRFRRRYISCYPSLITEENPKKRTKK